MPLWLIVLGIITLGICITLEIRERRKKQNDNTRDH